jgi:hypothetical protein
MVKNSRAARRTCVLVLSIFLVAGVTLINLNAVGPPDAHASAVPTCQDSSLKISAMNGDGLHHGVEFITFQNLSNHTCTLRGYPVVEAILLSGKAPKNLIGMYHSSPPRSIRRATDAQMAWAGGVITSDGLYPSAAAQKAFVPPLIALEAKSGTASSTLNWVDGPNSGTCPAFTGIRIAVDGGSVTRPLGLGFADPLCYEFAVTPIVRGSSGSMSVKAAAKLTGTT